MKKLFLSISFLLTVSSFGQIIGNVLSNPALSDINTPTTLNKWILHTPASNLIIAPKKVSQWEWEWDWSKATTFENETGNVGIGVPSNGQKLSVNGNINSVGDSWSNPKIGFNTNSVFSSTITNNVNIANYGLTLSKFDITAGVGPTVSLSGYQGLNFYTNSTERMKITFDGKVNIGTIPLPSQPMYAGYKLFVDGGILTKELRISSNSVNGWADYVFEDDYKLKPLSEVENFIVKNKHLPNVPSAKQIKEEGINVGDIARIQQEKIEELTLYIIALNKKVEELELKLRK